MTESGTGATPVRKKIATFCSYVPNELLYAAGFRPLRVVGDGKTATRSKAFFPAYICSYVMNCLDLVLQEHADLAGMVFVNCCHAMEILYETMREYLGDVPSFLINVPKNSSVPALEYFYVELGRFRRELEKTYQFEISDDRLRTAISLYNSQRDSYRQLEQLVLQKGLAFTTFQTQLLNQLAIGDPEAYIRSVQDIIPALAIENGNAPSSPRIMITGSVCAPLDIAEVVEAYGGTVVLCHTCSNGFRSVKQRIDEQEVPLRAIAQAYLTKPACARHCDTAKKTNEFKQYLDEYQVNAVIFSTLKFCPDQSYDLITMTDVVRERNLPFLVINSEYSDLSSGQIHTRVQAFLECLGPGSFA